MAFLTLNGVTVPTAKGGEVEQIEVGSRMRAASGAQLKDIRALKRRWKFTTIPMSELRSLSIMGMLQGQGLYLPHTSSSTTAANGRAPDDGAGVTVRSYYAADGVPSSDENGVSDAISPSCYSFLRETSGSPNLLTSAMAQATATTGVTATNVTLTVDSTQYWQGTSSFKMVEAGNPASLT